MTVATLATTCARAMAARLPETSRGAERASTTGRPHLHRVSAARGRPARRARPSIVAARVGVPQALRTDPFAYDDPFADAPEDLPDPGWSTEVLVAEGKFAGYTLLVNAFTAEEVPVVADLLLGSGMAGFPLERRTLEVYLRGAVPAFPYGTYLVGRLRAPVARRTAATDEAAPRADDDVELVAPASSWSEEKAAAHGPIVATVGVSFNAETRRRFSSLSPPTDCGYLSDLTVFESERGQGLGKAMLAAAETFAAQMRSPAMFLHVAMKKPGVVRLYKDEGYDVVGVDPGVFGWRGRLLMRKKMREAA